MKKFVRWIWLFFLLIFFIPGGIEAESLRLSVSEKELSGLIQENDEFSGYRMAEKPGHYGPENLFAYINGGAELYLAHGFRRLLTVEWVRPGEEGKVIILEIYDLGNRKNALAIFRVEKAGKRYIMPGGAEGSLSDDLLQFHKNNFYVKILALFPSEKCKAILQEMAHTIERRIGD